MPFTVTHIAAAVPIAWLCRWRVPFSALAIGSMVPDLAGFYPAILDYQSTHSLLGILTHCSPIGLIAYYVYHGILKRPLVDVLPRAASDRLRPWTERPIDFSVKAVGLVVVCVAIGAATHVLWDSFTHARRWGVEMVPQLESAMGKHAGRPVRLYSILQHGSSIVFLPPLLIGFAIWIRKQPREQEPMERAQMPRAVTWSAIGLMIGGSTLYFHLLRESNPYLLWINAVRFAVKHGSAVALIATLIYCVAMQIVWWRELDGQDVTDCDGVGINASRLAAPPTLAAPSRSEAKNKEAPESNPSAQAPSVSSPR
ncbi:MAG: DUF4184 family protein [Rubripirellula sp.]